MKGDAEQAVVGECEAALERHSSSFCLEGDKIQYDILKGLEDLRRCAVKVKEWVQLTNEILVRKPNRKRAAKREITQCRRRLLFREVRLVG